MNKYKQNIEKGLEIIREQKINFNQFKIDMAEILYHTDQLSEDEWVDKYNDYAWSCGSFGFESVKSWAQEVFEDCREKTHRIFLKPKRVN